MPFAEVPGPSLLTSVEDEMTGACTPSLTTMAGTDIQIVPVSFRWDMLEAYPVKNTPAVSNFDTFGCELTLLDPHTQQVLCDPTHECSLGHHSPPSDCSEVFPRV